MSANTQADGKRLGEEILNDFAIKTARIKAEQLHRRPEFSDCDAEDIAQELLMYLIQKADCFDPSRSKVNTFINRVINSGVRELLRSRKRHKRHPIEDGVQMQSFETPVDTVDETFATLGGEICDEDQVRRNQSSYSDPFHAIDEADALEVAMQKMPAELRRVCEYLRCHSMSSTMEKFGLPRRRFNTVRAEIAKHLKKYGVANF